jgi:hypothetical protein
LRRSDSPGCLPQSRLRCSAHEALPKRHGTRQARDSVAACPGANLPGGGCRQRIVPFSLSDMVWIAIIVAVPATVT